MSYAQFGYSSYATSSPFVIAGSPSQGGCFERGGVSPDAPPAYDTRLLSPYPRLPTAAAPLYAPATAPDQGATYAAVDAPSFYPALNSTYGMKDNSDPWRSISQSASYYYDPTLAAYGYGGLDFNGARRKNVTRDSTSTLKAWLNEHRKNPYPTKGEKIMLAIITKMTLTQVSTWFANARRRLKKENKMTWEPRNKAEGHDDDSKRRQEADNDDDDDDKDECRDFEEEKTGQSSKIIGDVMRMPTVTLMNGTELDLTQQHRPDASYRTGDRRDDQPPPFDEPPTELLGPMDQCPSDGNTAPLGPTSNHFTPSVSSHSSSPDLSSIDSYISSPGASTRKDNSTLSSAHVHPSLMNGCFFDPREERNLLLNRHLHYKPKIWSLADTATNKAAESELLGSNNNEMCSPTGWLGSGMSNNSTGKYQNCASASFQRFGSSSSAYNCSLHGFALQTDTPPQTPPNMKVGGVNHAPSTVPPSAYIEAHPGAYAGQTCSGMGDATIGDAHLQGDKVDGFSSGHVTTMVSNPVPNSNPRPDCIADSYDNSTQYPGPSVR